MMRWCVAALTVWVIAGSVYLLPSVKDWLGSQRFDYHTTNTTPVIMDTRSGTTFFLIIKDDKPYWIKMQPGEKRVRIPAG